MNKIEHGNGLIMIKDAGLYGIVKKVLIVVVIFEYHLKWYEMIWDTTNVYLWLFKEETFQTEENVSTKVLIMVCA